VATAGLAAAAPTAEQIVRGFFAALNAKDAAALSAIVQPDFTWTMMLSEPPTGYRAVGIDEVVAQFFKGGDGVFRAGDPKSTITAIVTQGERVMAETTGHGERKDGKRYDGRYAWAFELRDGKLQHAREYTDTAYAARFFDMSVG
jgi:ketosteroid isomerase-like protein